MMACLLLFLFSHCVAVQDLGIGQNPGSVSAVVNGWHIRQSRVDRFVSQKLGSRVVNDEVAKRMRSAALEHLVRRQVIMEYLKSTRHFPRDGSAVEMRIGSLQKRLGQVDRTLQQHLIENGMSRAELENEIVWEIAWQGFLEDWLSESRLEKVFNDRHRELDGTRVKVAHLLLRPDENENLEQVYARAAAIREEINRGALTWAQAVGGSSVAQTSVEQEGLIGWIEFATPMPIRFSRAAFDLDPGQISNPVETRAGIHLIKCLEVAPGSAGRKDVGPALRHAATEAIFFQLAEQHRSEAVIHYKQSEE